MKAKTWKEWTWRVLRTFAQAFLGYVSVNLVAYVTGLQGAALNDALKGLCISAVAAGFAAVMNIPVDYDESGKKIENEGEKENG